MVHTRNIIGIRREDKNRWERRVPLTPEHVKKLVAQGITVYVQPSNIRCFSNFEYEEAGAIISEDLSPAGTILAVKEVPIDLLLDGKTYLFFSHTIKAQPYNMPLLDSFLQKNIRMVDYEKITDANNNRLVKFGPFAGYAGMVDTLHAVGDRMLALGFATPFMHIGYSRNYPSLASALESVRHAGEEIKKYGLPREFCPFTITRTGTGAVAKGVQAVLDMLPCKYVDPFELEAIWNNKECDTHVIYVAVATAQHMVEPIAEKHKKFDKAHYYSSPQNYKPVFHEKVMPYTRVLMNCMYWDQRYPRLISTNQARKLLAENRLPLLAVGEIACDLRGSVEFFLKATTIDHPVYIYNLETNDITEDIMDPGILFLAVDHLPAEFPVQASEYFGDALIHFVPRIANSDPTLPYEEQDDLPVEIKKAVITAHKSLTPPFKYIEKLRMAREKSISKVLVLGSGFVAPSVVEYLTRFDESLITVASMFLHEAISTCKKFSHNQLHCCPLELDVSDDEKLDQLIERHNLIISLLPAPFHPKVAELCIKHKRNMITASYISPEMRALHTRAQEAGILILNELGLDPGIDHMSIMQMVSKVQNEGGRVTTLTSHCGVLPAPEGSNNPLGYKFSWSPRGVLAATQNSALFKYKGTEIQIPGHLLYFAAQPIRIYPGFAFELIPNRNSLLYTKDYNIDETVQTMVRGTLRYGGFAILIQAFSVLGLLDMSTRTLDTLQKAGLSQASWRQLIALLVGVGADASNSELFDHLRKKITEGLIKTRAEMHDLLKDKGFLSASCLAQSANPEQLRDVSAADAEQAIEGMTHLEMFNDKMPVALGVNNSQTHAHIDSLCTLLESQLKYKPGERDMVMMHHTMVAEYGDESQSKKKVQYTSTLCAYGDNRMTATTKTVGLPVAIAARLVLDGKISPSLKGVQGPLDPTVYNPIMALLKEEGVSMAETESDKITE